MNPDDLIDALDVLFRTPAVRALALHVWADHAHAQSTAAGWWDGVDRKDPTVQATKISFIHSEISEALEGIRKGIPDRHLPHRPAVEVELGDALLRIFDLAGAMGLDIGGATVEKDAYNETRPDHARPARAGEGGKKL